MSEPFDSYDEFDTPKKAKKVITVKKPSVEIKENLPKRGRPKKVTPPVDMPD